jgi:transposase
VEWVLGIERSHRGFAARVTNENDSRMATLESLVSCGLPRVRSSRIVVDQQMREWPEADATEYLVGFAAPYQTSGQNRHAVYEVRVQGLRILIPALVLMRAFFRPTQYLLPQMFAAQALDRVRFLDVSHSPPRVEFHSPTWRHLGSRYGDVVSPILWMSTFPSAMCFASSVHVNAVEGRAAVSLPYAKARLALQGYRVGELFLATCAVVLELNATEAPLAWAEGQSRTVYKRTPVSCGKAHILRATDIPFRADGSVDLADHEWDVIEPILFPAHKSKLRFRLDQRRMLDGILRKLALGTSWRNTPYPVGTWSHACFAYRTWTEAGTFQHALSLLKELRAAQTTVSTAQAP